MSRLQFERRLQTPDCNEKWESTANWKKKPFRTFLTAIATLNQFNVFLLWIFIDFFCDKNECRRQVEKQNDFYLSDASKHLNTCQRQFIIYHQIVKIRKWSRCIFFCIYMCVCVCLVCNTRNTLRHFNCSTKCQTSFIHRFITETTHKKRDDTFRSVES